MNSAHELQDLIDALNVLINQLKADRYGRRNLTSYEFDFSEVCCQHFIFQQLVSLYSGNTNDAFYKKKSPLKSAHLFSASPMQMKRRWNLKAMGEFKIVLLGVFLGENKLAVSTNIL